MLFLTIWWLFLSWTWSSAWPRPYDDWKNLLFYLGAGIFCVLTLWRRRSKLYLSCSPPLIFFLLYLAVAVLTLSKPVYEGGLALARLILWGGLVWTLTQMSRDELIRLMKMSSGSAAAIAMLSWIHLTLVPIWPQYTIPILAPVGHISYFSDFLALHIPFSIYLFTTATTRRQKILWSLCLLALPLGIWISATRSTIIGLAVALGGGAWAATTAKIISLKKLAAGLAIFLGVITLVGRAELMSYRQETPTERLAVLAHDPTLGHRLEHYRQTLQMIKARPFTGWGVGSFRFIYPKFQNSAEPEYQASAQTWFYHPHNEILHQASELGIFGLGLFLLLWGSLGAAGWRLLRRSVDRDKKLLAMTAVMGITIALVSWQGSTTCLFPLIRLMVAFHLALLLQVVSDETMSHRRFPLKKIYGLLIIFIGAVTFFLTAYHCSLYAVNRAVRASSADEAVMWADRARRFAPLAFDPLLEFVAVHGAPEGDSRVGAAVTSLMEQYPYVPATRELAARFRAESEN